MPALPSGHGSHPASFQAAYAVPAKSGKKEGRNIFKDKAPMKKLQICKGLVLVSLLLAVCGGLSACNTLDGMGQDLESAGRGMQNTF